MGTESPDMLDENEYPDCRGSSPTQVGDFQEEHDRRVIIQVNGSISSLLGEYDENGTEGWS